ncbi:MAG TPA: hypothetical protein VKV32_09535 [Stellaceae bacterium]|nr:hypothetical protein [Stellaceae bacterium]
MTPEDSSGSASMEPRDSELHGLADTARERARALAEEGKENSAQQIGGVATALRGAARDLEEQMPKGAELIRGAAASLEKGAERLRQRSTEEWLQSFSRLAHDRPAMLFGGALLAGFALSRFFNSSRPAARASGNSR